MSNDTDLIFEAYKTQIANEGIGDLLVQGGSAVARTLGKSNMGRKLLGSTGKANKTGQLQGQAGRFMSKGQEAAQVAKRVVAPVAGAAALGTALNMGLNAPASPGSVNPMGSGGPGMYPTQKSAPAAKAAPVTKPTTKPTTQDAGADVFKKFHGTTYDANSSMDKKKMERIQSLQKAGTPLTSKSVYEPAAAPAKTSAPAPQGSNAQPSQTGGKSSIKPLFSKGGLFNR